MAIRAKLSIIFFLIIIVPMFLLWARWQGTALGGIKLVLKQGLSDRAREISDQVAVSLQGHRDLITSFTRQPALENYARAVAQNSQALPDEGLLTDLSGFMTAHYKEYSALIAINPQSAPLFKFAPIKVNCAPRAAYFRDVADEEAVSAPPDAFNTATDNIFVSEVQQDGSGPHVKLFAPLRDAANNVK